MYSYSVKAVMYSCDFRKERIGLDTRSVHSFTGFRDTGQSSVCGVAPMADRKPCWSMPAIISICMPLLYAV